MPGKEEIVISVVIPAYNEADGLPSLHAGLLDVLTEVGLAFELIYCDDGSTDNTPVVVAGWHNQNHNIRLIRLSRNFGKESALAAGLGQARGKAIIMLDGDGQHPVEKIPNFISKWQSGAKVVVGISEPYAREGMFKRFGSWLFYKLLNKLSTQKLTPGASDFRLIDRTVLDAFLKMPEANRITRGMIDWMGFRRTYVQYRTKPRLAGEAVYSKRKLIGLAANSFVSLSATPLYIFGYLGIIITTLSFMLGISIFIEQLVFADPLNWNFTGTAMLGVLIIFLVGVVLMSQGILSVYISHVHDQSKQRPLYIIDTEASAGLD